MKRTCLIFFLLVAASVAQPRPATLAALEGVGIDQRLDATVPLDATFADEEGRQVTLGSFFGRKPVLLVPVYYTCPMLCSEVLHGVVAALRPLSLRPGRDFEVVVFSFNPADRADIARQARERYTRLYSSRAGTAGWHFLTGPDASIHALTDAIGFHFRYDAANKMFTHQSGVMILTPDGRLARYFYGAEYEPKDFNLGLIEAANGRIGSPVDKILLFCYHYDPSTGKYGAAVMNLLKAAAVATLLVMSTTLAVLWKRDLLRQRAEGGRRI
jgi:protein SCO1